MKLLYLYFVFSVAKSGEIVTQGLLDYASPWLTDSAAGSTIIKTADGVGDIINDCTRIPYVVLPCKVKKVRHSNFRNFAAYAQSTLNIRTGTVCVEYVCNVIGRSKMPFAPLFKKE